MVSSITNTQLLNPIRGPGGNEFLSTPLYPALALQFLFYKDFVKLAQVSHLFRAASAMAFEFEMQANKKVSFSQLYDFAIHKSPSVRLADGSVVKRVENFVEVSSCLKKVTELDLSKVDFRKDPFMLIHTLTPQIRSNIAALNFAEANNLPLEEMGDLTMEEEEDFLIGAPKNLTLENVRLILRESSQLNSSPTFPNLNSLNLKDIVEIQPVDLDKVCSFLSKGHGTVTYPDGDRYEGAWIDGMPDGQGMMFYSDGSKYEGAWKELNLSGKGKMTHADGSLEEGVWLEDRFFSGHAISIGANGAKLKQEWLEGEPREQKTKTYPNGDKLVGVWKLVNLSGQMGTVNANGGLFGGWPLDQYGPRWSSVWVYMDLERSGRESENRVGGWHEGFFYGLGKKTFENGDVYEGAWEEGRAKGQGTRTYPNGDRLVGMWIEEFFSGQGRRRFANGETYEGSWVGGNPSGQGTMTYPNGDTLVGIWVQGRFTGQGKRTVNGDTYEGEWLEGQPNGKGIMTYANGDWFEGTFQKGKFSQEGMLTAYANGEKLEGFWLEGQQCFKKRRF